jgi:hypothetical protein
MAASKKAKVLTSEQVPRKQHSAVTVSSAPLEVLKKYSSPKPLRRPGRRKK